MAAAELWRGRLATLRAVALLSFARVLVRFAPFHRWKGTLGFEGSATSAAADEECPRRIAALVNRAAVRLPGSAKCLPRAMVVSWLLRRRRIPHSLVFAARPERSRGGPDNLHAWIEVRGAKVSGAKIIGDLPGPWIETLRLDGRASGRAAPIAVATPRRFEHGRAPIASNSSPSRSRTG